MSIYSMINGARNKKYIHISKDLDPKIWTGRSVYVDESDFEVIDKIEPSKFEEWFGSYCEWCWGHGYGKCDSCKKYYRQLKLAKKINDKYKLQTGKNVWE